MRQVGEWELISDPELDAADPRLSSAENANTPEEWAALRRPLDARLKPGVTRVSRDLDLAAPDERRLAVVEDDGEASVGRDRVGRAVAAAADEHAPAAERVPPLEIVREPGQAAVEPLPVAILELGQHRDENGRAIERAPRGDPERDRPGSAVSAAARPSPG